MTVAEGLHEGNLDLQSPEAIKAVGFLAQEFIARVLEVDDEEVLSGTGKAELQNLSIAHIKDIDSVRGITYCPGSDTFHIAFSLQTNEKSGAHSSIGLDDAAHEDLKLDLSLCATHLGYSIVNIARQYVTLSVSRTLLEAVVSKLKGEGDHEVMAAMAAVREELGLPKALPEGLDLQLII